jgi:ElaB/YqjD/DUF883 family membrane-anchored ribosome-binding protein
MAEVEKTGNGSGSGILGDVSIEDAQQLVEQTREAVDQAVEQAATFIRERPIVSLAGALAIGYLLGKLASR